MLTKHGAKLLDFGLAKRHSASTPTDQTATDTLTHQGTISGTLPYMAPEQLEGKEADNRTDIFAFGSVLYEMLTQRKAFAGNSQATLIAAVINTDPPPLANIDSRIPPALDRIVRTCLAKDPEDRWQSARDIALELKFVTESRTPPPPAKRLAKWIWPVLAGVLLIGIIGIIGLAALLFQRRQTGTALVQLEITAPEKSEFSSGSAISPDWPLRRFRRSNRGKTAVVAAPARLAERSRAGGHRRGALSVLGA